MCVGVGGAVTLGLPHLWAYHLARGGEGRELLYQPPKGQSDFLNHFNNLGECDCPDSAAVSVLIRHSALSEPATREATEHITRNG